MIWNGQVHIRFLGAFQIYLLVKDEVEEEK